ncbi:MAG: reverse transcriptase-like protein [Myxococcales bacterium]|nr:reverse transcriptase-like protein [Myxococcales bacterium]
MSSPKDPKGKTPTQDEVLSFLLEHERLTKTLKHFGFSKEQLTALLIPASAPSIVEEAAAPVQEEAKAATTTKASHSRKTTTKANGVASKAKPKPAELVVESLEEHAASTTPSASSKSTAAPAEAGNDKTPMKKSGKTSATRSAKAVATEPPPSPAPEAEEASVEAPASEKASTKSKKTSKSKKSEASAPKEEKVEKTEKAEKAEKTKKTAEAAEKAPAAKKSKKSSSKKEESSEDEPEAKNSKKKSNGRSLQASLPFEDEDEELEDDYFDEEDEDEEDYEEESSRKKKSSKESEGRGKNRRQSSPRGRRATILEPEHYTYQRLLIYTDGAARGNPGESGAGVVLKTPEGEEVGRFGRYLGKKTNNHAEYEAVLLGLRQAREFGASEVTILSDSDLLVRQLLKEYRVRAQHLRELFDQVQDMLTLFEKHQVKRIGREKNSDADLMANRAIDERL